MVAERVRVGLQDQDLDVFAGHLPQVVEALKVEADQLLGVGDERGRVVAVLAGLLEPIREPDAARTVVSALRTVERGVAEHWYPVRALLFEPHEGHSVLAQLVEPLGEERARALLTSLYLAKLFEEPGWPSDNERLHQAFVSLEQQNIIGPTDVERLCNPGSWDEVIEWQHEWRDTGRGDARGAAFCTSEAEAAARWTEVLELEVVGMSSTREAVLDDLTQALRAHGFEPEPTTDGLRLSGFHVWDDWEYDGVVWAERELLALERRYVPTARGAVGEPPADPGPRQAPEALGTVGIMPVTQEPVAHAPVSASTSTSTSESESESADGEARLGVRATVVAALVAAAVAAVFLDVFGETSPPALFGAFIAGAIAGGLVAATLKRANG